MTRHLAVFVLACSLSPAAFSQDSGPGPDPAGGATQQQYDVTLYQRSSNQKGSLLFFAAADTSTARTTGDFQSNINSVQLSGTWRAYDLGTFAFWYARSSDATNSLSAFGWCTPDFIVGRATMNSSSGFWSFLSLFSRNSYFLHGNVASPTTVN